MPQFLRVDREKKIAWKKSEIRPCQNVPWVRSEGTAKNTGTVCPSGWPGRIG